MMIIIIIIIKMGTVNSSSGPLFKLSKMIFFLSSVNGDLCILDASVDSLMAFFAQVVRTTYHSKLRKAHKHRMKHDP